MTKLHTMNQRRRRKVMGPYAPRKPVRGLYSRWAADRHRNVERAKRRRQEPRCGACGGSCIEEVYGGHGGVLELPCSACQDIPQARPDPGRRLPFISFCELVS